MTPNCYAVRRLNPFLGVLQVLELPHARALSANGRDWELQIQAERPEHSWRSSNEHQPVLQYFRFGVWSRQRGLSQVPVSPILDLITLLSRSEELQAVLPDATAELPFPLRDSHELWALDASERPVALLASCCDEADREHYRAESWSATTADEHGFESASLSRQGIADHDDKNPRRHAHELEQRVKQHLGNPVQTAWLRTGDTDTPSLPLSLDWPQEDDRQLVQDYLDWLAPALLCLQHLGDATRARLEQAAARQATRLAEHYPLYPKILDRQRIDSARVEARLRRSQK